MADLNTPTIQRTRPDRARQISESTGRGEEWIRTPASFALVFLALLVLMASFAIGMVRP